MEKDSREENKADKEKGRLKGDRVGNTERDKGSEGVGSKRKGGGPTEQRVLSLFVGKCLRDGSLLTEFILIHQSQKNTINLRCCVCVCVCACVRYIQWPAWMKLVYRDIVSTSFSPLCSLFPA